MMRALARPMRAALAATFTAALLGALPAMAAAQTTRAPRSVPIGPGVMGTAPRHAPRHAQGYGYPYGYGYGYGYPGVYSYGYGYVPQVVVVIVPVPVVVSGISYYTPYDNGQLMVQYGGGLQQLVSACPATVSYTGQQWMMYAPAQLPAEQAQTLTSNMPALAQSVAPGLPLPCYTQYSGQLLIVTR